MVQGQDLEYFPQSYADSRQRFLKNIADFDGETGHWPISGRNDRDLFVDYLWLKPLEQSNKLFVITSGIHGSEAYTGAAMQEMFIRELLPSFDRRNAGLLLVHAMNPFGFKHHRRCTEAGVNLNRNFSVSGSIFNIRNQASIALQERLLPREPVSSLQSPLLKSFSDLSMDTFAKAVGPGQFERPDHLEFGGKGLEPQSKLLIEKVRQIMPAFKDIVVLDLHTGLGERGRLHLLREDAHETLHPELFDELFDPKADAEIYDFTPSDTEGFYTVYGAMNGIFGELARPGQRVVALTMEFGTLGHSLEEQLEAVNRWLVDHQGLFHGYASPELRKEAEFLNFERSYPQDPQWKLQVMKAARGLFTRVLERARNLK